MIKKIATNGSYIKLSVLVPNKNKKNDTLLPLVKKMPVVANFKPKRIEIWVIPSELKGVQVLNVYIT